VPNPLIRVPSAAPGVNFLELRNGTLSLNRDAGGVFSLALEDYDFRLFDQSFANNIDGSADASGVFSMAGAATTSPVELEPTDFSLAGGGTFSLLWNVFAPSLELTVPSLVLHNDTLAQWPDEGVTISSGFSFKSDGDFDTEEIPLPSFSFDNMTFGSGGDLADNYLRVWRDDGEVAVRIRDQRTFFASSMAMALDVSTSGEVSGSFSGDLTFDFKAGPVDVTDVPLAGYYMAYDSASDCQFQGDAYALGFKWLVCYGENCSGICTDVTIGFCPTCYVARFCIGSDPCP
jgi:hypothetical protein